ncbi:MAG: helix-turn-helix transcriptional regulator [Ktedonobacteraceae bacterium]|nr:helix-turn-helix transcriptional regulator [Ktedonobacteraceae bacterium]MBA3826145.1 helix-turn-helix transcriptional regulator [Ktedonobacterales bacterium]
MPPSFDDLGRFSDVALLILLSLAQGPKHGYAMIEDIQTFSGTLLEPGTLYGALLRLEQRGWILPQPMEERRRPYTITPNGMAALHAGLATLSRIVSVGAARVALT